MLNRPTARLLSLATPFLCLFGAVSACGTGASPDEGDDGPSSGTGGQATGGTSTGGTTGLGGTASATGGAAGTSSPTGGSGGTAGNVATGGVSTGGVATGGAAGDVTGGTPGTGGSGVTGGSSSTGGSSGAGPTGGAGMGGKGGAGMTGGTSGTGGAGSGIYISPTGNDSNAGTMAAPYKTLARAHQAATAGSTIWVMSGTYASSATTSLSKSGTQAAPISIQAVAGNRPLFDFATQSRGADSRGIEISGNYWHIKGIEIANAGDNCVAISGSNNTVENVVIHGCEDTGLQITVGSSQAGNSAYGANNQILNCDSYENFDHATSGENADGFAAKLRIGPGNVFRDCRAFNNADDGWDLFASNDVVVIDNCWAFSNGKVSGQNPAGDGNGFKLGGAPNGTDQGGAAHQVTRNASFENRACGFTRNNNPVNVTASDCAVRDNPGGNYCSMSCSPAKNETMTAAQAKAAARMADGSLPPIQ